MEKPKHHGIVSIPVRVAERALSRAVPGPGGCHISTYSVASHGYAQIGWNEPGEPRRVTTAHRAAWVGWNKQQVPDGFDIDHTCRVRRCVNPNHLRLLGWYENAVDGAARGSRAYSEKCAAAKK